MTRRRRKSTISRSSKTMVLAKSCWTTARSRMMTFFAAVILLFVTKAYFPHDTSVPFYVRASISRSTTSSPRTLFVDVTKRGDDWRISSISNSGQHINYLPVTKNNKKIKQQYKGGLFKTTVMQSSSNSNNGGMTGGSSGGSSSSSGSGDTTLNWDYDLWKEIKRRNSDTDMSTSSNSLETFRSAKNLTLQQKIKLWYLNARVKMKRQKSENNDLEMVGSSSSLSSKFSFSTLFQNWTLQKVLIWMNILMYVYQINTSYLWSRGANILQVINKPMTSPLSMDFMYLGRLASDQPYRFITSGFLHGSLLHLICNIQSWYSGIPEWLESAGGRLKYITIFLLSVIGGNICHTIFTPNRAGWYTPTVGASGGICGLIGYTYILCKDMNTITSKQYSKHLARYMFQLIIIGALTPRVSNAAHVGGFICGAIGGYFLGPRFTKSYVAKRWGNTDYLKVKPTKGMTPQLQRLMGPQLIMNNNTSRIPLYALGIAIALYVLLDPNPALQQIPWNIYIGLRSPGRLSLFAGSRLYH